MSNTRRKLTLVFAACHYPPDAIGGSATSVQLEAEALARAGYSVSVVAPRWTDAPPARAIVGISVSRYGVGYETDTLAPEWVFCAPWFIAATARAIVGQTQGAHIIHAQERRMLVGAWVAARIARLPLVVTLRDSGLVCPAGNCWLDGPPFPRDCGGVWRLWMSCAPLHLARYHRPDQFLRWPWSGLGARGKLLVRGLWLRLERVLARRADSVIFVSHALKRLHEERLALSGHIVHSAAPIAHPSLTGTNSDAPDAPVVLFVGKPSRGKGWWDFEDAVTLLVRAGLKARFVHIGDRPAMTHPSIECRGRLSYAEVQRALAEAAVAVIPPVSPDAFPRVALEARAAGCPVVGTLAGGLPEVIHGRVGSLVPPNQPRILADAIRNYVERPEPRGHRQPVNDQARLDALLCIYGHVIAGRPAGFAQQPPSTRDFLGRR